jgi:DNA-binding MarR family transcriptional regulator
VPPPEGLLRSRRQEQILALILTDPETEFPLSGLARRLGIPYSSVHREIQRAERFGVVKTRRFENLRLVRANVDSPYFTSLAGLLRR